MAGVFFLILFGLLVLPPFYLIGKLSLTNNQKLAYRIAAFALPLCSGLFTYYFQFLYGNIDTKTQFGSFFINSIVVLVAFGSWIVFIISCFNQQKSPSVTNQENSNAS